MSWFGAKHKVKSRTTSLDTVARNVGGQPHPELHEVVGLRRGIFIKDLAALAGRRRGLAGLGLPWDQFWGPIADLGLVRALRVAVGELLDDQRAGVGGVPGRAAAHHLLQRLRGGWGCSR